MDLTGVGGCPSPPPPVVTRHQDTGSTSLPLKHSMQTIALFKNLFFLFFAGAPGFLFTVTVTVTVSTTFLITDSDAA